MPPENGTQMERLHKLLRVVTAPDCSENIAAPASWFCLIRYLINHRFAYTSTSEYGSDIHTGLVEENRHDETPRYRLKRAFLTSSP